MRGVGRSPAGTTATDDHLAEGEAVRTHLRHSPCLSRSLTGRHTSINETFPRGIIIRPGYQGVSRCGHRRAGAILTSM